MKVLALDTTAECGSIALLDQGALLEEVAMHAPDGFAHLLFQEIDALLSRHGMGIPDVDLYASASGPGSFTGVRVGLTAVKGLAEATGRKVAAVSNLEALAWFGSRPLRASVIDARRGEVYGAVYGASLEPVQEEVVTKFSTWLDGLPEGELEIVTNGFDPGDVRFPVVRVPRGLAGAVGVIAAGRAARGVVCDPADIDANYVRRSDAELFWKDR